MTKLRMNRRYMTEIFVLIAIPLMAAGCVFGDDDDGGTAPDVDETPPEVAGSLPADGASGTTRTGPCWIAFSEPMDEHSVSDNTSVSPYFASTSHWSEDADTVFLVPYAPLDAGTAYTITVGADCEDANGNTMGTDVAITFTTGSAEDTDPPQVVSTSPPNGAADVGPGDDLRIRFDEPVEGIPDWYTQTEVVISPMPGDGWFEREGNDLVIHHSPFPTEQVVSVTVTTDLQDISGNALAAPYGFSFTTASDDVRPYLASADPENGETGVSPSTAGIILTFSEPMYPEFEMPASNVDARILAAFTAEPDWNEDYSEIYLPAAHGLLPGCTYWVEFEDVTDMAGNPIDPNPTVYSFTTSGAGDYFPVGQGYEWGYIHHRITSMLGGASEVEGDIRRVLENYSPSTGDFEEVTYYMDRGVWVLEEKQYLRKTAEGILHLGREGWSDGVLEEQMIWDEPLAYLKLPVEEHAGESWSISGTVSDGGTVYMTIDGSVSIESPPVDIENLFLDGTFRDCLVWVLEADLVMYEGGSPAGSESVLQKMVLCEGPGQVMIIYEEVGGMEPPDTMSVTGWEF